MELQEASRLFQEQRIRSTYRKRFASNSIEPKEHSRYTRDRWKEDKFVEYAYRTKNLIIRRYTLIIRILKKSRLKLKPNHYITSLALNKEGKLFLDLIDPYIEDDKSKATIRLSLYIIRSLLIKGWGPFLIDVIDLFGSLSIMDEIFESKEDDLRYRRLMNLINPRYLISK